MATGMLQQVASEAMMAAFLDKPTSTTAVQKVTPKTFTTMANATGQDGCDMLSMKPDNHVTTNPSIYVQPVDYNLFSNYKLKPGLLALGSFDDTAAIGFKPFLTPICPTICYQVGGTGGPLCYLTPVAHLASFFAYWRGGMKFAFKFSASSFTTARVRFVWLPDPTFSGSFPTNEEGDVINKVFDITNDSLCTITIPYLRETAYLPVIDPVRTQQPITSWTGMNGQLVMYIVNPVTNSQTTGSSTIDFEVFCSAAEDFEVAKPEPLWDGYVDGTGDSLGKMKKKFYGNMTQDVNAATDIVDLFRKPFETMVPASTSIPTGVQMGERVDSWPELLHRYSLLQTFSNGTTEVKKSINPWIKFPGALTDIRNNWIRVWRSFLFARGGYRLKVVLMNQQVGDAMNEFMFRLSNIRFDDGGNMVPNQPDDLGMADLGLALESAVIRPNIECEIPFYTPWNMICDGYPSEQHDVPCAYLHLLFFAQTGEQNFNIYISASDSTSFGWPTTPVPLLFPNSKNKQITKGGNLPSTNGIFNTRQSNELVINNNNSRDAPLA